MAEAVQIHDAGQAGGKAGPHRWRPGQSGNPAGAPKGGYPSLRRTAREYLRDHPEKLPKVIANILNIAANPDRPALAIPAAALLGRILGDFDIDVVDDHETQQKRLVVIKRAPDGTETVVEPQNGNGHHPTKSTEAG